MMTCKKASALRPSLNQKDNQTDLVNASFSGPIGFASLHSKFDFFLLNDAERSSLIKSPDTPKPHETHDLRTEYSS